jgi:hypothetical protein
MTEPGNARVFEVYFQIWIETSYYKKSSKMPRRASAFGAAALFFRPFFWASKRKGIKNASQA